MCSWLPSNSLGLMNTAGTTLSSARLFCFRSSCQRVPRCIPNFGSGALSLARSVERGGVERLARRLAGPNDKLESRKVALAGIERALEQRAALFARRLHAAGQNQRVTEHRHAVLGPEIEMTDPHLLVDKGD